MEDWVPRAVNILWIVLLCALPVFADEPASGILYRELIKRHADLVALEKDTTRIFLDVLKEKPAPGSYAERLARVNDADRKALTRLEAMRSELADADERRVQLLQTVPVGEEERVRQELALCGELIKKLDSTALQAEGRLNRLAEKTRLHLSGVPERPIRATRPTPTPGRYTPMQRF